jgi:chemotaxis protein MotB
VARGKKQAGGGVGQGWLMTFSDMVTLLLCFFVLLNIMSTLDISKFQQLVSNLQGSPYIFEKMNFAANVGSTGLETAPEIDSSFFDDPTDEWSALAIDISIIVDALNKASGWDGTGEGILIVPITMDMDEAQITIRVPGETLFDTLDDTLRPEGIEIIYGIMDEAVMPAIADNKINELQVYGHADIRPIARRNRFPDNLALSQARAAAAWRFVREHYDIPPHIRFGAMGYGEYEPIPEIGPGTTEEEWQQNRRVEFVLVRNFNVDKNTGNPYDVNP